MNKRNDEIQKAMWTALQRGTVAVHCLAGIHRALIACAMNLFMRGTNARSVASHSGPSRQFNDASGFIASVSVSQLFCSHQHPCGGAALVAIQGTVWDSHVCGAPVASEVISCVVRCAPRSQDSVPVHPSEKPLVVEVLQWRLLALSPAISCGDIIFSGIRTKR
eukprot:5021238-Amphidinium_carterae.1